MSTNMEGPSRSKKLLQIILYRVYSTYGTWLILRKVVRKAVAVTCCLPRWYQNSIIHLRRQCTMYGCKAI